MNVFPKNGLHEHGKVDENGCGNHEDGVVDENEAIFGIANGGDGYEGEGGKGEQESVGFDEKS